MSESAPQGPAASERAQRLCIAAVDDEAAILKLVAVTLSALYEVRTYGDPASALEAFRSGEHPDLILSDVMMPGMTGFELHRQVRQLPALRSVPFLFLTAVDDRDNIRRGMVQGADDYLTKPFDLQELRDAVDARLRRAGALRGVTDDTLAISSLGGVGISRGGQRLHWEARTAVVLLLYLLRQGGQAPLRELKADLWDGHVQDNSVRVLINRLRKMLAGVGDARAARETLRLELPVEVAWDASGFAAAAAAALSSRELTRIEAAANLYRGTFLPGFDGPWVESERARLEGLYIDLLEAAVELSEGASRRLAESRLDAFYDLG